MISVANGDFIKHRAYLILFIQSIPLGHYGPVRLLGL